jgi:type I site-specific restriction-modification system R (restriction) subunit
MSEVKTDWKKNKRQCKELVEEFSESGPYTLVRIKKIDKHLKELCPRHYEARYFHPWKDSFRLAVESNLHKLSDDDFKELYDECQPCTWKPVDYCKSLIPRHMKELSEQKKGILRKNLRVESLLDRFKRSLKNSTSEQYEDAVGNLMNVIEFFEMPEEAKIEDAKWDQSSYSFESDDLEKENFE